MSRTRYKFCVCVAFPWAQIGWECRGPWLPNTTCHRIIHLANHTSSCPSIFAFIWHWPMVLQVELCFLPGLNTVSFKSVSLLPTFLFPSQVLVFFHSPCISATSTCWIFLPDPGCFRSLFPIPIVTAPIQDLGRWVPCAYMCSVFGSRLS